MEFDPAQVRAFSPEEADPRLLLPYQARWVADKSPLKVSRKSRRIGLTWGEASDNVLTSATARHHGGRNVYYSGTNKDMSLEYIQTCASWARAFRHAASAIDESVEIFDMDDDEKQSVQAYSIWFNSGFRICALSSRPSNLRGRQGDVVLDEAAFHCSLEQLLAAALALTIWGGRVRVISSYNQLADGDAFVELCEDILSGKQEGTLHTITFRDAVQQGLARRVARVTGQQWSEQYEQEFVRKIYALYRGKAAQELDVIPAVGAGAYLTRAQILQTQDPSVPVIRIARPAEWALLPPQKRAQEIRDWLEMHVDPILVQLQRSRRHWYGKDFARKAHRSCLWVLEEDGSARSRCAFVLEMSRLPYDQQFQIAAYIVQRLPRWCGGAHDAGGNGGWLAEKMAERFGAARIQQVQLSQRWYVDNMPLLRAAIEDRETTTPDDPDILGDLRSIVVTNGVPKVDNEAHGADGELRHGDAAVAAALALFARKHSPGHAIEWASAGPAGGVQQVTTQIDLDRGFGTVRGDLEDLASYGY